MTSHKGLTRVNDIKEGDRFGYVYTAESIRETKTLIIIQARVKDTGQVKELKFKQGQTIWS